MMLIFGLMLLLLLQTAACLNRFCWFDQSDPCYAALGHKLNLQMVLDTSKYYMKIEKRINNTVDDPICIVKNDKIKQNECDLYNNRPEVIVINGTLIINRVIRADSGNYRLTLDHSDGSVTSRDLQVIVEAPIGSVEVSISCFSNQSLVTCFTKEGDQISYNWTLNGNPLSHGLMDRNNTIDLDEGTDGNISCSVKNHVSHAQKTIRVKPCAGTTTAPVTSSLTQTPEHVLISLSALGCVALILILLFISICYVYKKKQLKSTPAATGDTELIYSDITYEKKEKKKTESLLAGEVEYAAVRPQTKRKKRKEEEDKVQYSEVTFTLNHSVAPQREM